jgi:hypothetical protein
MATQNLYYAAIGTSLAEIVTLPVCTLKTNFQNGSSKSIVETAKSMYISGGIKMFYRASYPAVVSQVFSTSSKYVLYRYLDENSILVNKSDKSCSQIHNFSCKVLNGMTAGIMSSLITHPVDTIKIHMQMNTPFVPQLKIHGLKLFYRGYSKTLSKICVSSSLFFPLYDFCNEKIHNPIIASAISASIATTLMQPLDYLKTRHIYGSVLYQGWNPLIYYKGLSLNLARTVPHFIIVMTTIDFLKKLN